MLAYSIGYPDLYNRRVEIVNLSQDSENTNIKQENIIEPPALPDRDPNACADPADNLAPAMVVIPPGRFKMGSPAKETGRIGDEGPVHNATITRPMALGQCEVSVGQFRRFVSATGYVTAAEKPGAEGCFAWNAAAQQWQARKGLNWRNPGFSQDERHPVVCVNQADALAYTDWLSARTGAAYRLPSEAEWEYAARAETATARYWGEDADGKNFCAFANGADQSAQGFGFPWPLAGCDDHAAYTAKGGSFQPNAFGLYDTLGNVWEWTADCWHGGYAKAPNEGLAWLEADGGECGRNVARGGGWRNEPRFLRSASRIWIKAGEASSDLGFRLARDL